MNCTNCGNPSEDGSGLCAQCIAATPDKKTFSSLFRRIQVWFVIWKPYLKNPKVLITLGIPLIILVAVIVLWAVAGRGNGFIEYRQNIEIVDLGDDIHILVDDKLTSDIIYDRDSDAIQNSLDGSTCAFLTDKKELYIVNGQHLKQIAEDVIYYELSAGGTGLAYAVKEDSLYSLTLYNIEKAKGIHLTNEMCSLDFSVSPDGLSAAYYESRNNNEVLIYSNGDKTVPVTYDNSDLVGLSDKGKYIYAICKDDGGELRLYSFNTRGKRNKLGEVTTSSIKFNDDHTQIMFYNNGKSYISVKGKEGIKASANALYLVTVPNSRSASDNNAITYPVSSLFDHVYTCSDGVHTSAWLIQKNPNRSELLVSDVSGCTLDASARYLYYIYDNDELRWVKISDGASASDRYHSVAKDVDNYVLTGNRRRVYYINNRVLYSCNGKKGGNDRCLTDKELGYSLCLNRNDVAFFVMDGNLYSCGNGKKINMVLSGVESVFQSANGTVYAYADGSFYSSFRSGKLNEILQYD